MPVWDLLQNIRAEPLAELHHALLVAGRAEMAALAGKGQQVLMPAILACDADETVVQIAAVEVTVDDPL